MAIPQYFAHNTVIIDKGADIGEGTRIWHFSHLMSTCRVGSNCTIGQNVFVDDNVVVGDRVKIQNNVSLYDGVFIEDEVFLGPSVVFTNVIIPRSFINRKNEFQKTIVRKGATIGANATILCGIEIGAFSMIGAGAVVTKNVMPNALMIGNPAKQLGWVSEAGHTLHFNENSMATCPQSKERYHISDNMLCKMI